MIVCDQCKKEPVTKNGDICDTCAELNKYPFEDQRITPSNNVYLDNVLFEKLSKLTKDIEDEKSNAKKAFGKFMHALKSSFINKYTGKEINDPTPMVIIPKHSTIDRIQKILNHNISVYAEQNQLDTEESLEDFSVHDMYSDNFEESIYQFVDNIQIMQEETPAPQKIVETKETEDHESEE